MISVESLLPARGRQQPGAAGACRDRRHDLDVGARVEHRQRAADRLVPAALLVDLVAAQDVEVLVSRRQRIERRNLLHAFDDQNSWHGQAPAWGRLPSAARWQATARPSGRSRSGGSMRRQRSSAKGQRGAKRQPSPAAPIPNASSASSGWRFAASGWRRRDRGEQGAAVGVDRAREERVGLADLDDPAEIHHGDPVRDVPHDREIVRDEQIGQVAARAAGPAAG